VGHPVQPSCRSRVTQSRLHRTSSRWVLSISRGGDSTTSLGSLFQCSVTLRGKKFFLMFRRNFPCFILCPLPLVLSLGTTENSLDHSSCPGERPICSLVLRAPGHPLLTLLGHPVQSAFLVPSLRSWSPACVPGPCGSRVLADSDSQAYFGHSCLLRGFGEAL